MDYELRAVKRVTAIVDFAKNNPNPRRIVPSRYSKNYVERSLAGSLAGIKKNKACGCPSGHKHYPVLDTVVSEMGMPKILDKIDKKKKAIEGLQETINWMLENGRVPVRKKDNTVESMHATRIMNFGYTKDGKVAGVWYPEFDQMMEDVGYSRIFWRPFDGQVIDGNVDDILAFYKKNSRVPSQQSADADERKLYTKLIRYRQVKQGKTSMKWNPEIDATIKRRKIKNIFEVC